MLHFGGFHLFCRERTHNFAFVSLLQKKLGGNMYELCLGRYAAECDMITNKLLNFP